MIKFDCKFRTEKGCQILKIKHCHKCKFCKTQKEFDEAERKAKLKLLLKN